MNGSRWLWQPMWSECSTSSSNEMPQCRQRRRPPEYRSPEYRSVVATGSSSCRVQPAAMSSHWTAASSTGGRGGCPSHWLAESFVVTDGDLHASGSSAGPVDMSPLESETVRRRFPSMARSIGVALPMTRGMGRHMTRCGGGLAPTLRPTVHVSSQSVDSAAGPGDTDVDMVSHDPGRVSGGAFVRFDFDDDDVSLSNARRRCGR